MIHIDMLKDGAMCEVQRKKVPCLDVPDYLRSVLKVKPGCKMSINPGGSTYETTYALLKGLQTVGCKLGTVSVGESQ